MLSYIINFSIRNKLVVLLSTLFIGGFGLYSLTQIPIGAVPDVTNNQVQVITTSRNLSTQDMEQFITYPVELEMANLPGVLEIRSVTKFGLSVVTIVFKDDMGTYLPRQLIAEKIKSASEKIPKDFGTPSMGPVTTGLGEIYQYMLDAEPGYEDRYDATKLRTIQDWIVKRQLSGIPGVVEVNTWGGYLKQYEVAIKTEQLNAMEVTAHEIFTALEMNNNVAGGGYIEKVDQAYFIRGEGLVNSLEDIGNIVVKNVGGLPIYIKDVAKVGYGSAVRFGAITGNGEGEKVLGQVMMLKDANSKQVIDAVNRRVDEISKSLPEGVYINPFLDRSELIAKTTWTISENLILGFLIVIFVVVLLLGNFRSGLVVASVIPLCLLFALGLMYLFGVDANLMSLGAIDFGIIIDGAVIIVEFTAFQMTSQSATLATISKTELQQKKDAITLDSTSKMMNSAIFGQLIILIVFIPILSLSGVEGKMFRPMALTFSFALIGAMVLCFTYLPVVSSLILKPSTQSDKNLSVRLMHWLHAIYEPIIRWALKKKRMVLAAAALILIFAVFLFSRMGAEFVPTLDEGDFVIQPVLKTGTSLSKTIATTTQIEKILQDNFPEVKQVVTRIGAAEVPTDPMSMEESDVIIVLEPKNKWVSAENKDELANKFKEALGIIPGMEVEFTQPIEMRFNELITGVRADIAIKVFGENLDVLSKKGNEIKKLVEGVEGAADVSVEKIIGLPQMSVKYDRAKIARYGLNIQDLNEMVSMGFAGRTVGSVFEGEKRFDLVVRLHEGNRQDISNLRNLYVDIPTGGKVPLTELADIDYQKEAAKISRDDTRRRIVVGINVRDRDLQSVVDDAQSLIDQHIQLPVGYSITYGGQFENLQSAKNRLWLAVPIALLLIFILLYFAFKSVREALLIYSAIPLAAVGGVLFLWIRNMPFSISAGVGFIALFGIAVLNGIVLIEHFKELKKQSFSTMETLIVQGTKDRLRAVLLTASAAALGFLPMAISTSAGAEVQRPLATVVIGGLFTATVLTLLVLPVLYALFESHKKPMVKFKSNKAIIIVLLSVVTAFMSTVRAQEKAMGLEETIALALENHKGLRAANLQMAQSETHIGTAFDLDKTELFYSYDQNNLTIGNLPLNILGIEQDFLFPTVYFAQKKVHKASHQLASSNYRIQEKIIKRQVTIAFYQYRYAKDKETIYRRLDSLYQDFAYRAQRRFELGETNYLEKITAFSKQRQLQISLEQAQQDAYIAYNDLITNIQGPSDIEIKDATLDKIAFNAFDIAAGPEINYYKNRIGLADARRKLAGQRLLPDISFSYFQGTNSTVDGNLYGYQAGLKIPLFFGAHTAQIKTAKMEAEIAAIQFEEYEIRLTGRYTNLQAALEKSRKALDYYEGEGNTLSREIIKTAEGSFRNGEIDFFQYIQSIENAYEIQLDWLDNLNEYNQTMIQLNYLSLE